MSIRSFFPGTAATDQPLATQGNSQSSGAAERGLRPVAAFAFLAAALPLMAALAGCGGAGAATSAATSQQPTAPAILPSTASIQTWQNVQFTVSGVANASACTWQAASSSVLNNLGEGQFQGTQQGSTQVSVTCGSATASASVVVSPQQQSGPIVITSGGTYSGIWASTDPNTPAVKIRTDAPVILEDAQISGPGNLIDLAGATSGANVTIQNVTATALDPGVAGQERGSFVTATKVASLVVKNCTITGASFGVKMAGGSPSVLEITNNSAINLEDRASDGKGGFEASRPSLGHFVILNNVSALNGAVIAWNEVKQAIGQSSTEDVINIYNSQGSAAHPISVHDNYMEGSSSPVFSGSHYTGTAMITDGDGTGSAQPTAYVRFESNEVVATAGTGVGIAAGHDITAANNRIVSCGVTSTGNWYAWGANAIVIWNYYASAQFYNNTITGTVGGMVGPGTNDAPKAFDVWANAPDMSDPGNSVGGNDFTDPCLAGGLAGGTVNLQAEDSERAFWSAKVEAAGELIGDQHLN